MNMDKWVQLNNQAAGRDKLARLIQYTCRAIWDILEATDNSPALTDKFKTIEYIFSTFRKLLRFGKCIDVFYASFKTIHYEDAVLRLTITLSKVTQSLFLFADHLMWLARTGLFSSINVKKWSTSANKYWLFSIVLNLCRDVYEIFRIIDLHKSSIRSGICQYPRSQSRITSPRDLSNLALQSYGLLLGHKNVAVDFVKNICDAFIPLTALGYTNLKPRTIGLLGAISSIAGLIALIEPTAKLSPS